MYLTAVTVLALFTAAFTSSKYIFGVYFGICVIIVVLYFGNAYYHGWKFTDKSLKADLKDIGNTYMSSDDSHMWVAEWNGKVVGMVGLLHDESHEPEVVELYRMYVLSSYRRKGIAILSTTNAQKDAFDFYQKSGFQLIKVVPFRQKLPTDLEVRYFKLEL